MYLLGILWCLSKRLFCTFLLLVPTGLSVNETTSKSVVVQWANLSGSLKNVSGFFARAYEELHEPGLLSKDPIQNCTTELSRLECAIEGLKPSTNYTVTVAAFIKQNGNQWIYGDESAALRIKTGKLTTGYLTSPDNKNRLVKALSLQ